MWTPNKKKPLQITEEYRRWLINKGMATSESDLIKNRQEFKQHERKRRAKKQNYFS